MSNQQQGPNSIQQAQAAEADGMIAQAMAQAGGRDPNQKNPIDEMSTDYKKADFKDIPSPQLDGGKKHHRGAKFAFLVAGSAVAVGMMWPVAVALATPPVLPYTLLFVGVPLLTRYVIKHRQDLGKRLSARKERREMAKAAEKKQEAEGLGLQTKGIEGSEQEAPTKVMPTPTPAAPAREEKAVPARAAAAPLSKEEKERQLAAERAEEAAEREARSKGYKVLDNPNFDAERQAGTTRPWAAATAKGATEPAPRDAARARQLKGYYSGVLDSIVAAPSLKQMKALANIARLRVKDDPSLGSEIQGYRWALKEIANAESPEIAETIAAAVLEAAAPGRQGRAAQRSERDKGEPARRTAAPVQRRPGEPVQRAASALAE